jgi:hypothetical protein
MAYRLRLRDSSPITGQIIRAVSQRRDAMKEMHTDQVDGYQVPVDPMDDLQCDSCQ